MTLPLPDTDDNSARWNRVTRELWQALEPIHACAYYSPETADSFDRAGLSAWDGYMATRAAPLGDVDAAVVNAVFFNFKPDMVARHVPAVWERCGADHAWELRVAAATATLDRFLTTVNTSRIRHVTDVLWKAVAGADLSGRSFAAAHLRFPRPEQPLSDLWVATTFLREYRGDGHVAALVTSGLSGLEAHVLQAAWGRISIGIVTSRRGWTTKDWDTACAALQQRGLLDEHRDLTEAGDALKTSIEHRTDLAASGAYRHLRFEEARGVVADATEIGALIVEAGGLPTANALGLPT